MITITIDSNDESKPTIMLDVEVAEGTSPMLYDLLARRLGEMLSKMPEVTDVTLCR